ncbi:hypothetical protein B0H14DRAFT_3085568 [Mycena olivaceomarginata]|nr:hypothetical protein B0H14DRAFT_3085568 [Mycena olivaceomarginata]
MNACGTSWNLRTPVPIHTRPNEAYEARFATGIFDDVLNVTARPQGTPAPRPSRTRFQWPAGISVEDRLLLAFRCMQQAGFETVGHYFAAVLDSAHNKHQKELLPRGSTLAPIIISTDKPQLTRFKKGVRRSPSSRPTILIGYILVTKLEIFSQAKRAAVSHQLFHDCMQVILEPLRAAGVDGVEMDCADGFVRRMFPILAAYIADYPEQCLVACCRENSCPRCLVQPKQRGESLNSTLRDPGETLRVIVDQSQNQFPAKFVDQNLRPINPFWADFPHCDIFSSMTPDLLHELTMEIDRRFRTMTPHPTLRHFTRDISLTSQWTGNERKNMEKVFLGVLAQATDPAVQRAVAAIIDFIYYAHFETHCDESLSKLDAAWAAFHKEKSIFLELEICKHFDINKLHKLKHYVDSIRSRGTADGFNTENTERLHIDFAKAGYRATTKLARQEAVYKFGTYLQWNDTDNNDLEEEEEGSAVPACHPLPDDPDSDDEGELGRDTPSRSLTYRVPKNPSFPRVPAATIVSEFKLDDFLKSNSINPHHPPDVNSTFPVYKRLSIPLPQISEVASHVVYDTVRAVRAEPGKLTAKGIMPAKEGQFDTVLVRKDTPDPDHHPIHGISVARIRVIFRLPEHYGSYPRPLAYVDWYKPLKTPVSNIRMHEVSLSSRNHRQNSSIIPITEILRSCHLIPVFGKSASPL